MNFDDLENGQRLTSVSYWQACLLENADGVLSVCRKTDAELPGLDCAVSAFGVAKESIRAELERLLRLLQIAVQQLPQKQSFFGSESDRKQGYVVSCRFLEALEKIIFSLRSKDVTFLQISSSTRECERSFLQAEAMLGSIQKAAKKQGMDAVFSACQGCLDGIEQKREQTKAFLVNVKAIQGEIQRFCQGTVPDFCNRISVLADLEHEGSGGNSQGVLQLLGEMRHAVERVLSSL